MNITEIKKEAYRCYQLRWLSDQGYSLKNVLDSIDKAKANAYVLDAPKSSEDTLDEYGINGSLYVCYDEFCDMEFTNAQYVFSLLESNEKLAKLYQLYRVGNYIAEKYAGYSADHKFEYGVSVPGELLLPSQLMWSWSCELTLGDIMDDIQQKIDELEAA